MGGLALVGRLPDRRKLRSVALYVALLLASFGAYFLARFSYYEVLLPNPVYLKVGFGPEILERGFRYVAMFFLTFLTPFLWLKAGFSGALGAVMRIRTRSRLRLFRGPTI